MLSLSVWKVKRFWGQSYIILATLEDEYTLETEIIKQVKQQLLVFNILLLN